MSSLRTNRWLAVAGVALLLGIATFLLVRYVPSGTGAQLGDRAPDFRVQRLADGDSINLRSAYRGHVTLINVWATWCLPCQAEMPSLERLYQAYRNQGFRVAATSIDNQGSAGVRQFVTQHRLSFDILQDQSGNIQEAYQMMGVPESFLLDRSGHITYIALGAQAWDSPANRQRIERLIAMRD